ncbi:hypothetical protein KKJ01_07250 [Xenorhabdus bovienii]|uniref:Uncharacterized protein n=1 Tax=Xenorhabdus bovienii TaxID=40576 RepID=A0AAJ1MYQ9_XENBV|nr:hypothetical protein [Xenorhabdus bovienii]MDE1478043.1 hypothetical protein [Xenorhabdus bovienii]MDE9509718.1 hypothetical protein [Xenorhabdus bovienii]MDE9521361.1 hypothetical protein [Xenorhabdus bovienii]MDE9544999.1 hypothetical protein [Xenorhabdus bovienii]
MNNIYKHTRVSNIRINAMSDSELQLLVSSSDEVIYSITNGIKSIANLVNAAANSEEYSSDDAMTDLNRLSRLFSVLPLIIEAEYENHVNAIDEIRERKKFSK